MVNVGGFVATVVVAVAFGSVLDHVTGPSAHAMRWALAVPVLIQSFGVVRVLVWFRRVRAIARQRQRGGRPVPVLVGRARWWDIAPEKSVSEPAAENVSSLQG